MAFDTEKADDIEQGLYENDGSLSVYEDVVISLLRKIEANTRK